MFMAVHSGIGGDGVRHGKQQTTNNKQQTTTTTTTEEKKKKNHTLNNNNNSNTTCWIFVRPSKQRSEKNTPRFVAIERQHAPHTTHTLP